MNAMYVAQDTHSHSFQWKCFQKLRQISISRHWILPPFHFHQFSNPHITSPRLASPQIMSTKHNPHPHHQQDLKLTTSVPLIPLPTPKRTDTLRVPARPRTMRTDTIRTIRVAAVLVGNVYLPADSSLPIPCHLSPIRQQLGGRFLKLGILHQAFLLAGATLADAADGEDEDADQ